MKLFFYPLALAVAVSSVATVVQAQYLYSLNTVGNVSVNGNKINTLKGSFDPSAPLESPDQAWRSLAIVAGDQFALRGDGLVVSNGVKMWQLPVTSNIWFWTQLQIENGSFYELRQDGKLAMDKDLAGTLPQGNYYFSGLQVVAGATYSLRTDGNVYKNTGTTPLFTFRAGAGVFGGGDGAESDTLWMTLKRDSTGQYIYALRTDGVLYRGQLTGGSTGGEQVDSLPFPNGSFTSGNLYTDFEFDQVNGAWIALRADGNVYRAPNALTATNNFPGGGNGTGVFYMDLAVSGNVFFVLRSDGRVYSQYSTNLLVKLPGTDYGRMEMSAVPPNFAGQKNILPAVVQYTIPVNTETPVRVPVIATDVETPASSLIVTPVTVPPGAVWDANALWLTWTTSNAKGNFLFTYTVDDGAGKPKTYKSTIQVKLPDTDPAKNKPPYLPKINKAGALVGYEYRMYIPLNDPDGDVVTAAVDPDAYPFNAGARYDAATSEFIWTPTIADLGKKTAQFFLNDGLNTKTFKLKILVNSPIFVQPLPGP
jgi:hypothetical protein